MKAIGKIVGYLVIVLVGGALLAPPLYWATQAGISGGWLPQSLAKFDFTKYFNRATLIVAIGGLYPFLRWVGARRISDLEIEPNPQRWPDLGAGIAIGVVGLWIVAALLVTTGQVKFHEPFPTHRLLEALGTAVAVSIIEEVFFRGALFGALRRELSWPRALAFLAPFFAIVHFLKPNPRAGNIADPGWLSGFELIPHAFWQFSQPVLVLKGFLTLVTVGAILGYVVVATRSLYLAIGLHLGWVFALRSFALTSRRVGPESIWFGRDLTQGLAALFLLGASAVAVVLYLRWRQRRLEKEGKPVANSHSV